MSRRRKYIPLAEQLASALACLLPQEQRDELRRARVPAKAVIRLFSPDHIWLHSLGGPDFWWNLDPKLRPAHAEKSRRDTSVAAKVKRLSEKTWGTPLIPWPWPKKARQPRRKAASKLSRPRASWPKPKRKLAPRGFLRAKWRPVAAKQLHPES